MPTVGFREVPEVTVPPPNYKTYFQVHWYVISLDMEARQSSFEQSTPRRLALLETSRKEVPCPDFLVGFRQRDLKVPVRNLPDYLALEKAVAEAKEPLVSDTLLILHTYLISVPVLHFHLTGGLPG